MTEAGLSLPAGENYLPAPTAALVRQGIAAFDTQGAITEPAIQKLLQTFPQNTDASEVLLKVIVINQIYSTGIFAVQSVATRIVRANIDAALQAGDESVVHRIDRLQFTAAGGKDIDRSIYSFATKYCALHQPEHYAIYDGLIATKLLQYRKRDGFASFGEADLRNYPKFKDLVLKFREYYGVAEFTLREVDQFLWTLGKGLLDPAPSLSPPMP